MGNIADGIRNYGTQEIQQEKEKTYLETLLGDTSEFASDFDEGAQNMAASILPEGWVDPYTPTVAETPEEAAYLDKLRVQFPDKTDEELLSPSFSNTVNKIAQSATTVTGNMASGAHRLLSSDTSIANALAAEFAEQNYTALPTNIPFAPGGTYSQTGVEQSKPDFQGIQDEYNALASKDYEDFDVDEKAFWNSEAGSKLHDINKDVQKYKHAHENIERFKTSMDEYVVRTVEDYRADEKFLETYKNSGGGVTGTLAGMLEMVSDNPELAPVSFIENLPYMLAFAYGGAATKVTLIAAKDEENLAAFVKEKGREPTLKERARITVDSVGSVLMESFGDKYVLRGKARGVFSKIDKILPPGLTRVVGSTATETISGAGSEAFDQDAVKQDVSQLEEDKIGLSAAREGIAGLGGGGGAAAKNFVVDTLTSEESKLATAINQQVDATYTNQDATGAFNQANIDAQINPNQITPPTTTAEDAQATREAYLKSIVQADEEADSRLYHGSGESNIEQFSTDHVGESYRTKQFMPVWGNFFTNDEKIANWYENQGRDFNEFSELHDKQQEIRHQLGRLPEVASQRNENPTMGAWDVETTNPDTQALVDEYRRLGDEIDGLSRTYRVENGAKESEILNWDNTLNSQSELVETGAYKIIKGNPSLQSRMESMFGAQWTEKATGNDVYTGLTNLGLEKGLSKQEAQKEASLALNSVGIRGVKYEDVTKVGKWKAASKNPQNYVLFNDEDATIQNPRSKPQQQQQDYIQDTLIQDQDKTETPKYQTSNEDKALQRRIQNTLNETDEEWAVALQEEVDNLFPRKDNGYPETDPPGTWLPLEELKEWNVSQEHKEKQYRKKRNNARKEFFKNNVNVEQQTMEDIYKQDLRADAEQHEIDMNVPEDKFQDGRITNPEPMKANAALKEVMSKLPYAKYVDFQQVEQILKPNGQQAFGVFINDMVKHVENLDRTTLPHESFHHFLKFATTEEHRRSLFDIIRKREGNANKSVVDIEEIMTQEVSEVFVGKTKREVETPLKKFYAWIKDLVQAFKRDGFKDSIELRRQYREFMSEDAKPLDSIIKSKPDTAYINEAKAAYQKSPREYTTKMIEFLESALGSKDDVSFSHIENMIKGGLKQASKRDKAIINYVLNLPQYKSKKGTKEKVKVSDIVADIEKELLDISIIQSEQTYNNQPISWYGLSNIGREGTDVEPEALLLNTNFEHGVVGHFPDDFDLMVYKDDLEIRSAQDRYHVVMKNFDVNNMQNGGFRESFDTEEQAQEYIDNFDGASENKAGLYGHLRAFVEEEKTGVRSTRKVSYLTEGQADPLQGKYDDKLSRSNKELRRMEEKEITELGERATHNEGGQSIARRMSGVPDDQRAEAEVIGTFNDYKKGKKHLKNTLKSLKSLKESIAAGETLTEDSFMYTTKGGFEGEYEYMDKVLYYINDAVNEEAAFHSGKSNPGTVTYNSIKKRVDNGLLPTINERIAAIGKESFTRNDSDPAVTSDNIGTEVDTAQDLEGFIKIVESFVANQDIRIGEASKGVGDISKRLDDKYEKEGNYYRKKADKDTKNLNNILKVFKTPSVDNEALFRVASAHLLIETGVGGSRNKADGLSEPAQRLYDTLVHTLPQREYTIETALTTDGKEYLTLTARVPKGYTPPQDVLTTSTYVAMRRENTPKGRRALEKFRDKRIRDGQPVVGTDPQAWTADTLAPYAEVFESTLEELAKTTEGKLTEEQAKEIRLSDQFKAFAPKNYEIIVDTYIRDAWLKGSEVARFPTAHTISLIEGYITEDVEDSLRMSEADVSVGMEAQTHLGEKGIVTRKTDSTYDDEGGLRDAGDFDIVVADTDDGAVREFTLNSFIKTATMEYGDSFEYNMDTESFKDRVKHLLSYTLNSNDYLVAETELMNTSAEDLLDSPNESIYEAADTIRTEMTQEFKEEMEGGGWRARLDDNHPGRHNYSGWVVYTYEGDEYIAVNENSEGGVVLKTGETFSNQVDANTRFELGQISNTHGNRDIAHRYANHTNDKSIDKLNKVIRKNNKERRKRGYPIKNEISKKGAMYKYIEKIRPDLHEVTDEKGFTWYETKITDADGDAVMLFQTQDKITESQEKKAGEIEKEALEYSDSNKFVSKVFNRQSTQKHAIKSSIAKDLGGEYSGNVEVPEGIANSIGDRGSRISVDGNDVYFNISVERDIGGNDVIFLPNIAVSGKNKGLGTKFMEAMKKFADTTSQDIVIYKVTNDDFFRKFDWLEETELGGSFKYKAKKGNESLGLGQLDDIWKKAHTKTNSRQSKPLERQQSGMIDQMSNDDIALVGGMRSGNSKGDETRRMYIIYDMANMDEDFTNAKDQEIGSIQVFTEDATNKIRGIVDIKIPVNKRKQGHARKVIESLVNSEFSNKPFKIYDIKKSAYPFWKKMGVTFVNHDFGKDIGDTVGKIKGRWGTVNAYIGSEADIKKAMGDKHQDYLNSLTE